MSKYRQHHFSFRIYVNLLIILLGSPCMAESEPGDSVITGVGAHFSWAVMSDLHQELEEVTGKKIKLYGRESMMGAGCNAGIKHALSGGPDNQAFGLISGY